VRRAFLEQPGLCLTLAQAERLWDLRAPVCERTLRELIVDGFLVQTEDGHYCRPDYVTFCG
jgi:hypothetical protein